MKRKNKGIWINTVFLATLLFVQLTAAPLQADETVFTCEQSVYAQDSEEILKTAGSRKYIKASLEQMNVKINAKTIMPIYHGSLIAYAQTGDFDFAPYLIEGGQGYLAEVTDTKGGFAGIVEFSVDGKDPNIHMYMETTSRDKSTDFNANQKSILALMKKHQMNTEKYAARMMWVTGMGYVYYVTDGAKEAFIAANLKGTNGDIFTEQSGGIVLVDEQLMQMGKKEIEKNTQLEAERAVYAKGEIPMTGGIGVPAYTAAYSNRLFAAGVCLLAFIACIAVLELFAKRAKQKR